MEFSVSACTRAPRAEEVHGRDYYFFELDEFKKLINEEAFVEWEMVYEGKYYGTLKAELERIWQSGKYPLVDIDVMGALAIQDTYPDTSLTIFVQAPSLSILEERLRNRGTETRQSLDERLSKASLELGFVANFDIVLINDDLDIATQELVQICSDFLDRDRTLAASN